MKSLHLLQEAYKEISRDEDGYVYTTGVLPRMFFDSIRHGRLTYYYAEIVHCDGKGRFEHIKNTDHQIVDEAGKIFYLKWKPTPTSPWDPSLHDIDIWVAMQMPGPEEYGYDGFNHARLVWAYIEFKKKIVSAMNKDNPGISVDF